MSDPATAAAVRVLLVDDQELVRTGFRMIVDAEPDLEVVGEASDGRRAVDEVRRLRPDLVLMDVQMPVMDGLAATRLVVEEPDPPSVVILTTFERDDYIFEALRAGASGFLLKNTPPEDLLGAVRTVAGGEALLSPSVTRRVVARFATAGGAPVDEASISLLTDREREVAELLARGLSNAEIAERLFVGEATVKTHVSRVLAKQGLRDRVQAVVWAYESGLVRPGAT